jgi:hypothetical protein
LTVNGITMIVPNNSIVQMPAATFSWADLFNPAVSAPVGNYVPARTNHITGRMGMALNDTLATHFPSYEVRGVGNIVTDEVTGTQTYIVGLIVPAAQQGASAGAGYINFIDYDGTVLGMPGRFRVGGIMGNFTTGTLCELNDPVGRFGAAHSPDPRFSADTENPTITTANGYPVGIPTVAPPGIDPDRPDTNRPLNNPASTDPNQPFDPFLAAGAPLKRFTMPTSGGAGTTTPDPYKQVPLKVGDWVNFSGTLMKINQTGPNTAANMFMAVHSLTAHLSVKTQPGTQPAYVRVEEFLFGVGDGNPNIQGPTVAGIAQETSTRAAMVAFTTDSDPTLGATNLPGGALFGIDVQPDGSRILQQFPRGSTALSPVDFAIDDNIRGRMRWQVSKNPKPPVLGQSNAVGAGKFYRMYALQLTGIGRGVLQLPAQSNGLPGLISGQYQLPIFEYIFGEGTNFGEPVPPFNFNDFGFLTVGEGRLDGTTGPAVGPLDPFPAFN